MKRILTLLALVLVVDVFASHIVGGEFELLHISGSQYRLNLIWYFDVVNNPNRIPEAQEPATDVAIFRKRDNALVRTVRVFFLAPKTRVRYTQPACSTGELITDKLIYTTIVSLTPEEFGDAEGYYISWERCCRNYFIGNIISEDPTKGGIGAGQTFYLEFSPVVKNDQPFINSSPRNFPTLNDYACPGKPYYVDFAGVDDDGDSLAYSLVTPLNTHNAAASPGIFPRPYPTVSWKTGFGLDRIVNGSPKVATNPDLSISVDGFLRVTPRSLGLYVFAVKVEEFRDNEKIGETRRDFQMLVVDCRVSVPPKIVGKRLNDAAYTEAENLTVSFSNAVPDEERCILVRVTDLDASREADNFTEFIRIQAVGLNFKKKNLPEILPAENTGFIHNDQSIEFRICFPKCPYFEGGAYQIGIVAFDDACALPLSDTLKVAVTVQPPHNERAKFVTDNVTTTLKEGEQKSWAFEAHDADLDPLTLFVKVNGFLLSTSGIKITQNQTTSPGVLSGTLNWDAYCDIYDFTNRTNFIVELMVDDDDVCDFNEPDTATFNLSVLLPGNANPIADTDLTPDPEEFEVKGVERRVLQSLNFNVSGKDLVDNDPVTLRMAGRGFKPSDYGMSFQKKSGTGQVASSFAWDLKCDKVDPSLKDKFELLFIAIDSTNKCRVNKRDTVHVFVDVLKPINKPPTITIASLNPNVSYNNGDMKVIMGQPIRLSMTVRDKDIAPPETVRLDLVAAEGTQPPVGYQFTPVNGASPQTAMFEWTPDCSIFTDDLYSNDYTFRFIYLDNHCQSAIADTVEMNINIRDVFTQDFEIDPPNVFTPNGDSFNDYFAMERYQGDEIVNLLPPDNCTGQFKNVRIYNRWGRPVFESTDRNFRWYGTDEAAGVYYYYIYYTNREYKGSVSLRN